MRNVFSILKRDMLRLLKAPAALIVVAALIIIPSLYTWVNVFGFWNPYDNTGNMRVCFVNEDEGGSHDLTGELNLGNMIDETLRDNTQLGWAFMSREEAMEEVQSGKAYAAFIVPKNFTSNLLTLFSGDFTEPQIQYYVNEKLGPVSPKVSDAGSTTLDETINSTFVQTVSETVVEKLNDAVINASDTLDEKDAQVVQKIQEARNAIKNTDSSLSQLNSSLDESKSKVDQSKKSLEDVHDGIDKVKSGLDKVQESTKQVSSSINEFVDVAFPAMSAGMTKLNEASSKANKAIKELSSDVESSQADLKTALEQQKIEVEQVKFLIEELEQSLDEVVDEQTKQKLQSAINDLNVKIEDSEKTIQDLEKISKEITSNTTKTSNVINQINQSVENSTNSALSFSSTLFQTTLPTVNRTINDVTTTASKLELALNNQHVLVDEIDAILSQVQSTFDASQKSISATKTSLNIFDDQLGSLQTDVSSFSLGKMLKTIADEGGLDGASIGDFISSPTIVEQKSIYELNAYGSAMAPLFMNLTFWIGAFMLLVILRQEVDSEGVKNLTIGQRYVSRWGLLTIFAILQALLCDAGILILGVQTVNVFALVFISCLASVAYLSLMFMLSTTLQHIGKGLCVLLAFLQIPGATGLYPIEMTAPFFQDIYPFFPFTYGINGLRETICGFYGSTFGVCCAILIAITLISVLIGIYLRPYLTNFNKLFAKEIREGGLFVGEEIEIPTQRFRLSQLIGYLANKDEYRVGLERRAKRFMRHYGAFKKYAIGAGVAVSVLIGVLFSQFPVSEKPTLLTLWLGSLVVLLIVVVGVEHAYDSIERQINLDNLSEEELKGLFTERNKVGRTTSELFTRQKQGRGHKVLRLAGRKKATKKEDGEGVQNGVKEE